MSIPPTDQKEDTMNGTMNKNMFHVRMEDEAGDTPGYDQRQMQMQY